MTRGERNNNPGNIDRVPGQTWQGQSPDQNGDPRFVVFLRPEWGIRAIAVILTAYVVKHGCKSIRDIINRWAPPEENDTASYISDAARQSGIGPDDPVDVGSILHMAALVRAIIKHENGEQPYSSDTILGGLSLAGIGGKK